MTKGAIENAKEFWKSLLPSNVDIIIGIYNALLLRLLVQRVFRMPKILQFTVFS
jgi:hypothetical protein